MAVALTVDIASNAKGLSRGFRKADQEISVFGKKVSGNLAKAFRVGGLALASGAAAGIAGVTSLIGDIDKASRILVQSTGATGNALKQLNADTRAVFATVPQSMEQVATAVGQIQTRLGSTGHVLQQQTKLFLDYSRVTGTDAANAVNVLSAQLTNFNEPVTSLNETLGDLLRIQQATGLAADKMAQQFNDYGPIFTNIGLTIEQTAAVFGQLAQSNIAVSRIAPGINKFARDTAALGGDPLTALRDIVMQIETAETQVEALDLATKAFGAEGAQRMTTAIRAGNFDLREFNGLLGAGAGHVGRTARESETLGEKFARLGNRIKAALIPVVERLLPLIQEITKRAEKFVRIWEQQGFGEALKRVLIPSLKEAASAIFNASGAAGVLVTGLLAIGATKVVLGISSVITQIAALKAAQAGAATAIAGQGGIVAAIAGINPVVAGIGALVLGGILTVKYWDEITGAIQSAAEALGGFAQEIGLLPDRVTVSEPDVHTPEQAGGRFGGPVRERLERERLALEEAAAARAAEFAADQQAVLDRMNGNVVRWNYNIQQEVDAARDAHVAQTLAGEKAAAAVSALQSAGEQALAELRGETDPIDRLINVLTSGGEALTPEAIGAALQAGTAEAERRAQTIQGFGLRFADSLRAQADALDPSDKDYQSKLAAIMGQATEEGIQRAFIGMVLDTEDKNFITAISELRGIKAAVNALEIAQIVGGQLGGFTPLPGGGGTPQTPEQIEEENRRTEEILTQRRRDRELRIADQRRQERGPTARRSSNPFETQGMLGLSEDQEDAWQNALDAITGAAGAGLVGGGTGGAGFRGAAGFLPRAGAGASARERLRLPGATGGPESRANPFTRVLGAATGREGQTNRAIRTLAAGQERTNRARAAGFGQTPIERATQQAVNQALGLPSGGGGRFASPVGGAVLSGQLGYLSAALGPSASAQVLGGQGFQGLGFAGLSPALQQSALAAVATGGGAAGGFSGLPAVQAVQRAISGGAGGAGGGGSGGGGSIAEALGLPASGSSAGVAASVQAAASVGGLGGFAEALRGATAGAPGVLNPGGSLLRGAGELTEGGPGGFLSALAGLGGAAAGVVAGLSFPVALSAFGAGATASAGALFSGLAASAYGIPAAAGVVGAGALAAAAAPIAVLGGLGALLGYRATGGEFPTLGTLGISEADIHDPSLAGGRFRQRGTTINNNFPAGTDPGAVTRAQERQRQLGYTSRILDPRYPGGF